jgi:hypothetical protein
LAASASKGTLIPAPAAAVVKNFRREVTLYFLSDDVDEVVLAGAEPLLELSEDELLELPESFDEEDDSFLSALSEEPFSDELSLPPPSFLLGPPLPGFELPPLA